MRVIASIVTYNADIERLKQNIAAIFPQVDEIIVIDNGSNNIKEVSQLITQYPTIHKIEEGSNLGIAKALNDAVKYADSNEYKWIITLDQDSVAPKNLVSTYSKYVGEAHLGMLGCKIIDRNFGQMSSNKDDKKPIEEVKSLITSACMLNVQAWKEVGGFCEEMFIDSVDFDICYSLREHGYRILRTNDTFLLHEVGHSEIRNFLGKERQIFHHSPVRYYYMARNGIYLGKRHKFLKRAIYRSVRGFFLMLLFDDHKAAKVRMMLLGFWHATIGRYGKL